MNLPKQAHLHKVVGISVATSVGTLLAATVVLNTIIPGQHGNVLSQTSTNATSRSAHTADSDIIVSGVTEVQPDPVSGKKRITVNLTFQNLSTKTLQVSPGLQMFLHTGTGQLHDMTAKYLAPRQIIGGPLEPGARSDLSIDFDIPNTAVPAEFIYQSDAAAAPNVIKL